MCECVNRTETLNKKSKRVTAEWGQYTLSSLEQWKLETWLCLCFWASKQGTLQDVEVFLNKCGQKMCVQNLVYLKKTKKKIGMHQLTLCICMPVLLRSGCTGGGYCATKPGNLTPVRSPWLPAATPTVTQSTHPYTVCWHGGYVHHPKQVVDISTTFYATLCLHNSKCKRKPLYFLLH